MVKSSLSTPLTSPLREGAGAPQYCVRESPGSPRGLPHGVGGVSGCSVIASQGWESVPHLAFDNVGGIMVTFSVLSG